MSGIDEKAPRKRSANDVGLVTVRPVQTAHEQVAEQLRQMIVSGELPVGARLPNEGHLAAQFGVSRPTVREALRALASQDFLRTVKGANGGSFVQEPSIPNITNYLFTSMTMLRRGATIDYDEFLEARMLFETPAARLAAVRRSDDDLAAMTATISGDPANVVPERQNVHNRNFHLAMFHAAGNPLLTICAQPVFTVLHNHLQRSEKTPEYHARMASDHGEILEAVRSEDADAAEAAMKDHLDYLHSLYASGWYDYVNVESTATSSPPVDADEPQADPVD
jgi:DNA-binding FadR family transcriptional regulator